MCSQGGLRSAGDADRRSDNARNQLFDLALDGFTNFCAYRCPIDAPSNLPALSRTEPVLRLRSHIVAKAAAALPFIRPCDWSRMSVTKQGPSYLTQPENLGTSRIARA